MNILYTLNDKFVPQVAAGICSVCENNKEEKELTFYLISKEITDENKEKLISFGREYKRDVIIKELGDIKQYFDFEFDTTGWNSVVLARLVLDKFLPQNVERILYLDGDTIVRNSLNELWNTNLGDNILAASIEPTVDKQRKINLGLNYKNYYNSGVLLIDLKKWRDMEIGKKVLEYYKNNSDKIFAPDQDAINGSLANEIYALSPKYNFFNIFYQYSYSFLVKLMKPAKYIEKEVFEDAVKNPTIIHYLGEERPWRIGNHHRYKKDYLYYLNKTPWENQGLEKGWKFYFICWDIFNFVTKPFPGLRYKIINALIPAFINKRSQNNKK